MKRYMLFAGDHYYPSGGMNDYRGDYDTLEMAIRSTGRCDWWHVYDTKNQDTVTGDSCGYGEHVFEWAREYDATNPS